MKLSGPLAAAILALAVGAPHAGAGNLETVTVKAGGGENIYVADGVVEAVRQSAIAAQVIGRITELAVKAGDAVKSGQVLARIDERAAAQQAVASQAQVTAAQAQLDAARKEFGRSQRLYQKQYISQAALDQAEAQFKATQAQANAMLAQAGAASAETSFRTLRAPYNGVLASVTTELGDMAAPGKLLMTVYDPGRLRVVVNVPESYASALTAGAAVKLEFPGAQEALRWQKALAVTVLPTADPASHTVQIRLTLPANIAGLPPGMFARAHLPVSGQHSDSLMVPAKTVIKRTDLYAVYVVADSGKPQLRQVRLGKTAGDQVEILAGLRSGERIALDPLAAARQ
jgi:RND family efflux transporter MFP subunit